MPGWAPADYLTGAAFAAVLVVMLAFLTIGHGPRRTGSAYRGSYRGGYSKIRPWPDVSDVSQQLHFVMNSTFKKQKLLNQSEYRVFKVVEEDVAAMRRGHRVFAQTCLGEILTSPDSNAFRSINSKRVDMLIVDWTGIPVVAIEYQGAGHYQGTAAARDAVKKEALRKAGVHYIEVVESDSSESIKSRLRHLLGIEPGPPHDQSQPESPTLQGSFGRAIRQ